MLSLQANKETARGFLQSQFEVSAPQGRLRLRRLGLAAKPLKHDVQFARIAQAAGVTDQDIIKTLRNPEYAVTGIRRIRFPEENHGHDHGHHHHHEQEHTAHPYEPFPGRVMGFYVLGNGELPAAAQAALVKINEFVDRGDIKSIYEELARKRQNNITETEIAGGILGVSSVLVPFLMWAPLPNSAKQVLMQVGQHGLIEPLVLKAKLFREGIDHVREKVKHAWESIWGKSTSVEKSHQHALDVHDAHDHVHEGHHEHDDHQEHHDGKWLRIWERVKKVGEPILEIGTIAGATFALSQLWGLAGFAAAGLAGHIAMNEIHRYWEAFTKHKHVDLTPDKFEEKRQKVGVVYKQLFKILPKDSKFVQRLLVASEELGDNHFAIGTLQGAVLATAAGIFFNYFGLFGIPPEVVYAGLSVGIEQGWGMLHTGVSLIKSHPYRQFAEKAAKQARVAQALAQ